MCFVHLFPWQFPRILVAKVCRVCLRSISQRSPRFHGKSLGGASGQWCLGPLQGSQLIPWISTRAKGPGAGPVPRMGPGDSIWTEVGPSPGTTQRCDRLGPAWGSRNSPTVTHEAPVKFPPVKSVVLACQVAYLKRNGAQSLQDGHGHGNLQRKPARFSKVVIIPYYSPLCTIINQSHP